MIRHRQGPNEKQVFAVTLRRRHRDVKNGVTACSASKADPGCSSFVPLCVPEGQFVSSGRKDHGRAEAALIARYGAEVLLRDGRAEGRA